MKQLFVFILLFSTIQASPCSVFFIDGSEGIVAKNLDWFSGEGEILINPRGLAKTAILIDSKSPVQWVSKYASITFTGSAREFPWEGLNEKGLSVNVLELPWSQSPSNNLPTITSVQWVQFILDTSANLNEAVENAQNVRVSGGTRLHYFVCDISASCATIENVAGSLVIHAGSQLPTKSLTNDTYDISISYMDSLKGQSEQSILYDKSSVASLARFARSAIWSINFDPRKESAVAHAFRGLQNLVEVIPATANAPSWRTFWSLALDLKTKTIYWRTLASPEIKSVSLGAFPLDCRATTKALDINVAGSGDMSFRFRNFSLQDQSITVDQWVKSLPSNMAPSQYSIDAIKAYPSSLRCVL